MDYLKVMILSMFPVTELRGSIPIGIALDLNPIGGYIASGAGSTLVSILKIRIKNALVGVLLGNMMAGVIVTMLSLHII